MITFILFALAWLVIGTVQFVCLLAVFEEPGTLADMDIEYFYDGLWVAAILAVLFWPLVTLGWIIYGMAVAAPTRILRHAGKARVAKAERKAEEAAKAARLAAELE